MATVVIPFAGAEGKTRLHSSARIRRALAQAMFCDVLAACVVVGRTRVVTPDEAGADAARDAGAEVVADPGEGQGAAVQAAWRGSSRAPSSWSTPTSPASCRTISGLCSPRRRRAASRSSRRSTGRRTRSASRRPTPSRRCTAPAAADRFRAHAASLGVEAVSVALPNLADDVDTMDDLTRLQLRVGPRTQACLMELEGSVA